MLTVLIPVMGMVGGVTLPILLGVFVWPQRPVWVRHETTGVRRVACVGWSWTYGVLGWLVPLFRGEWGRALWHAVLSVLTLGVWQWVGSFLYHQQHLGCYAVDGMG